MLLLRICICSLAELLNRGRSGAAERRKSARSEMCNKCKNWIPTVGLVASPRYYRFSQAAAVSCPHDFVDLNNEVSDATSLNEL